MIYDDVGERAKALVSILATVNTLEAREMIAREFLEETARNAIADYQNAAAEDY